MGGREVWEEEKDRRKKRMEDGGEWEKNVRMRRMGDRGEGRRKRRDEGGGEGPREGSMHCNSGLVQK